MKKLNFAIMLFLSIGILLIANSTAQAAEERFAIAPNVSTLGIGGQGVVRVSDSFNARLGVNAFQYDYDGNEDDVDYNFELGLLNISAILDWFPLDSAFRLSGGLIITQNEVDMQAKATAGTYDIGDATYTAAQVGTLNGNISFNDVAPYVGIGWGSPFSHESDWSVFVDLGAMYQGSPEVDLTTNGTLSGNAGFLSDLNKEESNLESDLENFQFYPVLSLGVAYRF